MKHYFTFLMGLLVSAAAYAEGPIACQEPIRTVCINSCGTNFCRASCEQQYCGTEVPQPTASPTPAPAADGFPDTDRFDIVCENGLEKTLTDTLLPIYKQHNLLSTYKLVFKAWGCELQHKPWTLQAGPEINPWAGSPEPTFHNPQFPPPPPFNNPQIPPPGCFNAVWAGQWFCQGNGGWNAPQPPEQPFFY